MKRVLQLIGLVIFLVIATGLVLYALTPRDKLLSYLVPEIIAVRISNLHIREDQATMHLQLKAISPLLPVFINKLQYNFKLYNQSIGQGSQNFNSGQKAKEQQLAVPIRLNYSQAVPLLQRQMADSAPVSASFQMLCRIPLLGTRTLTSQNNLPITIPLLPKPQISDVTVEDFGFQHGRLVLTLTITNPNDFDYYIRDLSLNAQIAGYLAEASNIRQDYLVRAKQVIPIKIPSVKAISKQNTNSIFRANSSLAYNLKTAMIIEPVSTAIDKISFSATSNGSITIPPG